MKSPYRKLLLLMVNVSPEIGLAGDGRDQRREEILHERGDHPAECRAHHDGDGQIYYISPEQEFLKPFQHHAPPMG